MARIYLTWGEDHPLIMSAVHVLTETFRSYEIVPKSPPEGQRKDFFRDITVVVAFFSAPLDIPSTPDQKVHDEVAAALSEDVPVVPVLVDRTPIPSELPPQLAALSNILFGNLRKGHLEEDIAEIIEGIERWMSPKALAAARVSENKIAEVRALHVATSSDELLIDGLHRHHLQILVGRRGSGLRASALATLTSLTNDIYRISSPSLEALEQMQFQLNSRSGLLAEITRGAMHATAPDLLYKLANLLTTIDTYLVIILFGRPQDVDNLPTEFVVQHTAAPSREVFDRHFRHLVANDSDDVRIRALAHRNKPEVQTELDEAMPDKAATLAAQIVKQAQGGDRPAREMIDPDGSELPLPARGPRDARINRDYWTTDDTLGHRSYAEAIAAFVRHADTRPPLTIGISGAWGAGKTSLMRMVQELLDPPADKERWTRQQIKFSRGSRDVLLDRVSPRVDEAAPRRITVGELFRRVRRWTRADEVELRDLDVTAPDSPTLSEADWRPTVWFNPWMYQNGEQVWAGLAHEIITQITGRMARGDRERFWLELNLRRVDRQAVRRRVYRALWERLLPLLAGFAALALLLGTALLTSWLLPVAREVLRSLAGAIAPLGTLGILGSFALRVKKFLHEDAASQFRSLVSEPSLPAAARKFSADQTQGALDTLLPDPDYRTRLGFLHLVQTDMRHALDLVATPSRPLVVFVDDLDRCSPGTVCQVIEAVNLFLAGEFPNCIFLLAVEPSVIAAHIESTYKDLADNLRQSASVDRHSPLGWRFLEKIVQLPMNLPSQADRSPSTYLKSLFASGSIDRAPLTAKENIFSKGGQTKEVSEVVHSAEKIDKIAAAIRDHQPTIEQLPQLRHLVQYEVLGDVGAKLQPETVQAALRVFSELYSDADAYEPIVAAMDDAKIRNPREIKRFVNLYRFYTFIGHRTNLSTDATATPETTAKIVTLTLRWPHLRNTLRALSPDETRTVLEVLEQSARADSGDLTGWYQALQECGLAEEGTREPNRSSTNALRRFLATDPPIAEAAHRFA
ncbi:P-loop NTPase fold protein [Amycolatopsis vastitatis]|uniref:KAP NTPase domain-containing protein n=1 Tax=Amycolatopsis vastitatis TaxID=1905142 RepID=A0A229T376_9PSEU|nr:P-loop NTPase fold protein [Amycolatopsis vastitatis]OXM65209.1 hypothetical protein CF165_22945 [Amycolatopsis vastitatis]